MEKVMFDHNPTNQQLQGGVLVPVGVEQVELSEIGTQYQCNLLKFDEEPMQEQIDKYLAENVDVQKYSHKHPEWLKRLPETSIRDRVGALLQGGVLKSNLSKEEFGEIISQYPAWEADHNYKPDDGLLRHNGKLYQINQEHTSQGHYPPDGEGVTALYSEAVPEGVIEEWEQRDSTNPYMKGDKVTFEGRIHESTIDNNTWSPADYPQGWTDLG